MRITLVCGLSLFLVGCASAPKKSKSEFNPAHMDAKVAPGDDIFRFANGGWLDGTEIPAEYPSWSRWSEIEEHNQELLHAMLEEAAAKREAPSGSLERKLGDFYGSGMDVGRIESNGMRPLKDELDLIDGLRSGADLPRVLAHLHKVGVGAAFAVTSEAGLQDSRTNMAWVAQGGLGLPERDYYTREDADSVALREQYQEHVRKMLELSGLSPSTAEAAARDVMKLETRLAQASTPNVELRDPHLFDRKVTVEQMVADAPHFDWRAYLSGIGLGELVEINQPMPKFFAELDAAVEGESPEVWRSYLRWQLVHATAGALPNAIDGENFRFFGTVLQGIPEQRPRWKRVLGATSDAMGEVLGQAFVERTFSPKAKKRAQELVNDLLAVMRGRIERVPWMSDETRAQALGKLDAFGTKIGFPDRWRDYSKLAVGRDSFVRNVLRANEFDFAYRIGKVGQPIDPAEWNMTPQELNAYYNPLRNEIVFPAAILQPPFFSEDADAPLNYGAIGAVIGHEITHGFDDEGSQFDAQGNLRNWWTPADREEFDRRTAKLVEQYDAYEVLPGVHVNGKLTLGENLADLGGLSIAYEAMQRACAGEEDPMIGGFTREQRFFLAFQRVWCAKARDEYQRLQVNTNPHSPARFRATGPVANMPEFAAAFGLGSEAPALRPEIDRVSVW